MLARMLPTLVWIAAAAFAIGALIAALLWR